MKIKKLIFILCALLYSQIVLSLGRDSINFRLAYNSPVIVYKSFFCNKNQGAVTIANNTETDEYFYITAYKKIFGKVYIKGVSSRQIVSGWVRLNKEQLYILIKETSDTDIQLYNKPREDVRYYVKLGESGIFPVTDFNIRTGWVAIRYDDGQCYWVSPKIQCPWYTECYGN